MDQLPRLGKRELICLLSFTCNYVVFVWRGFLFLWVLGMGYVILLWHSLSLPYNYFLTIPAASIGPFESLHRSTKVFSADGNTLLDEITKINCTFAASTTFRVILTDSVVTNIMYYLVPCKIAQFVDRSIGI